MAINININNHQSDAQLRRLHKKLDLIMAKQDQLNASLERLNAVTNDIAADLTLLKEQIGSGTVSGESLDKLDETIAKLEELGASTENPVPEPTEPAEGDAKAASKNQGTNVKTVRMNDDGTASRTTTTSRG